MKLEKVFYWRDSALRITSATAVLQGLSNSEVLDEIKERIRSLPEDWYNGYGIPIAESLGIAGGEEGVKEAIRCPFLQYFSKIRMFHGCRPVNYSDYLESGIVRWDPQDLDSIARNVFRDAGIKKEIVETALFNFRRNNGAHRGHVYVAVDDHFLIDQAGHYLIRGSEFLQGIAAALAVQGATPSPYKVLEERGIPTILCCDIPTKDVAVSLDDLWFNVITNLCDYIQGKDVSGDLIDYAIPVDYVPPEQIVEHYHPKMIPDPIFNGKYYPPVLTCPHC